MIGYSYHWVVPESLDKELVIGVFGVSSVAIGVFVVLHYPAAAYYSRKLNTDDLLLLGKKLVICATVLCCIFYIYSCMVVSFTTIYITILAYLLLTSFFKIKMVFNSRQETNAL
jgi:hypothetical protein